MPDQPSARPPAESSALAIRERLDVAAARALLVSSGVAGVAGLGLVSFVLGGVGNGVRLAMQGVNLALLAVLAFAYWRLSNARLPAAAARWISFTALLAGVLALGVLAAVVGIGVHAPSLGLVALLIALAGLVAGGAGSATLAVVALLVVLGLHAAELNGWIAGAKASATQPASNRVVVLVLLAFIGLLAGRAISRIYLQALDEATRLGNRLQGLLQLGTDWVWEQDPQARLTHVSPSLKARSRIDPAPWLGRTWWDLPGRVMPVAGWAGLRERIGSNQPYRDELVQIEGPAGRRVWARLSGEPMFDAAGQCTGWSGVGHDVSVQVEEEQRRRLVQEQLAAAKEQAEAANSAKSAFLATMSHEIRTPLNGALGMIRLAIDAGDDAVRRDEYLRHAATSASSLADIITGILDLSRIESGRLQLESARFDLHELLRGVLPAFEPQAREKGLALACALAPELPRYVTGDALRVRQVLVNFVANAIKFTASGRVDVEVGPAGPPGRVRFEVRDTGPGIAPDVQSHLFRPFVQADASTTREFGGTGLGLSICRELATLMGGEVGLVSVPGQGSRFWAELPLPSAAAPQPDSAGVVPEGQPLAGMRVLVAEDNAVNMLIARETLHGWGAQVDEVGDGANAVQRITEAAERGQPFDAVLMDMHMPAKNGLDATVELRRSFDKRQLPIIALTAAALVSEQHRALEAGMNDFVAKPIDAPQLLAALQRARLARAG